MSFVAPLAEDAVPLTSEENPRSMTSAVGAPGEEQRVPEPDRGTRPLPDEHVRICLVQAQQLRVILDCTAPEYPFLRLLDRRGKPIEHPVDALEHVKDRNRVEYGQHEGVMFDPIRVAALRRSKWQLWVGILTTWCRFTWPDLGLFRKTSGWPFAEG